MINKPAIPNGKADLHLHTTFSDGAYSPQAVVNKAKNAGLSLISISDHDNLAGIEAAVEYGKMLGLEVIPGVEISTDIEDREIHLLGYFIDPGNEDFRKYLEFFRQERFHRAKRIINRLNNLGISISLDAVMGKANNNAVGRPHVAQVMIEKGYVNSLYEAFDKYLGNGAPAFERKVHVSPQSAIKLISDAGGLSFIAHPGYLDEKIILSLIKYGVDGIEVIHPSHSPSQVKYYTGIVNEYCLLASGGSDFHGGRREDELNLGKYYISHSSVEAMRKMLLRNSA